VGPRAGLDDIEKRKFLTLLGLELCPIGHLGIVSHYPGSNVSKTNIPKMLDDVTDYRMYIRAVRHSADCLMQPM
jgi:hypothetical protein